MRFVLVVILIIVPGEVLAEISGKPRIVDGDTIEIGQYRIRLHGIDAPFPGYRSSLSSALVMIRPARQ